jgi:bifunctional DNA-binding transcriptional regulator/antitoxin component of YhaV-PrlF toxin-antitoxin module
MGASKEDIETIVKELLGTFRYIIKDKNGNYFCTDLFKKCEQNQRIIILEELSPFLSEDCVDNFATHPIQALIDRANTELEYKLIIYSFNDYNKLHHAFLEPNGAYTILKIIERIPDRYRTEFNFIFTSFVSIISKKKIDNSQNSPIYIFPNGISKSYILASFNDKQQTIFLQRYLMSASAEEIDFIIKELKGKYRDIMKDKNGNYFSSDLFKTCDQKHRIMILEELSKYLSKDCIDKFATYPIQALIEKASSEIEYKFILDSFYDNDKLLNASYDHNGAYVYEKIFESIPNRYRTDLNLKIISFILFISRKRFGIITVKKFISLSMTSTVVSKLMELVRNNFMYLAEGEYSNYLIQHLLEQWNNTPEGNEIKKLIINNFKEMKQNKYSSYICEMFVENITPEEKMELIQSLYH